MKDPIIIERQTPGILDYKEFDRSAGLSRYFWDAVKEKDSPKLSIAVMSHRNLDSLKSCVEYVLKFASQIDCELVLMDNASEDGDETFDYLMSVPHDRKKVIKMQGNMGRYYNAARGWSALWKHCEGDYILHLNDDHFVTENSVQNMMRALDSDISIGMVNPVSSNAWMMQDPGLTFSSPEEMFEKAREFNVYDPKKWEERIYCAAVAWMFRRELLYCLQCANPFGPELSYDVAIRLAGYKVMLLGDTWVHHNHDYSKKETYGFAGNEPEKVRQREYIARSTKHLTFGMEMFRDICVFEKTLSSFTTRPYNEVPRILTVDVRAGQGLLDLKNSLRRYGIFNTHSTAFSTDYKCYPILYTVADEAIVDNINNIAAALGDRKFDCCLLGTAINCYAGAINLISALYEKLDEDGQLLFKINKDVTLAPGLFEHIALPLGMNAKVMGIVKSEVFFKAVKPMEGVIGHA